MSAERPTRDELGRGMTVKIVQDEGNQADQPIIGDVLKVITSERTHPDGIKVKLESGAVGRVEELQPEADEE